MKIISINMRKALIAFILPFFILTNVQSQLTSADFRYADSIATAAPDTFASIESLTKFLIKDFEMELLKTRVIYFWIINHIEYDNRSGRKSKYHFSELSPEQVYSKRKTICAGYAELFTGMCDIAGIRSAVSAGYTNDNFDTDYRIGDFFLQPDHGWNIVEIDDNWYYIDLTYDRFNLISPNDSLDFLLSSDELFKTRLPAASVFQLCSFPISLEEFGKDSMIVSENHTVIPYAYSDSIDYFLGLSDLQKKLYLGLQYFNFNQACPDYYGAALEKLADSIYYEDGCSLQEQFSNIILARNTYFEALKYLSPVRVFFKGEDGVYSFKSDIPRKSVKRIERKINYIEKKNLN
jgi:hypothetical protein